MPFEINPFFSRDFDLPGNGFFFKNSRGVSLSFILDTDTKTEFYSSLLKQFSANVLIEPDEHTMVLANPDMTMYFHATIPAFSIQYIEDCFKLKTIPDPTLYYIKNSCPYTYTKDDIFDCWFHKTKKWPIIKSDIDNKFEISGIKDELNSSQRSDIKESLPSIDHASPSTSTAFSHNSDKKTRLSYYTPEEDMKIVKYIVKKKYAFNVTGKYIWEMMERENVCKYRSWQSMKERYLKRIKSDLIARSERFSFLSSEDLKVLRQGLSIDCTDKSDREEKRLKFQEEQESDDDI